MFLFLKFYLGHLIADFILQFDELYALKVKSKLGHFFHVLIHFFIYLLVLLPYLKYPIIWITITSVTTFHYFQDNIKYRLMNRAARKAFWCYTLDQVVHIAAIAVVLWIPVSHIPHGFPNHPTLNLYYLDNTWTILSSLFIWNTFGGSYLLHNYRKAYTPDFRPDYGITTFEMVHAMLERTAIAGLCLGAPSFYWLLAVPLVGLFRLSSEKLKSKLDFAFSLVWSILIGGLARMWL